MSDDFDNLFLEGEYIDNIDPSGDTVEQNSKHSTAKTANTPKKAASTGKTTGATTAAVSRQPKRIPLHQRQPLDVRNRRPEFVYRVVNDVEDRIERFKLAGWVIDEDTTVGDARSGQASPMGSATSAPVGRGRRGIIMRIPRTLYEEDQAYKQRQVDDNERAMLEEAGEAVNKAAGGKDEWRGEIKIDKFAVE